MRTGRMMLLGFWPCSGAFLGREIGFGLVCSYLVLFSWVGTCVFHPTPWLRCRGSGVMGFAAHHAFAFVLARTGKKHCAMMAMTTSSSISVKPLLLLPLGFNSNSETEKGAHASRVLVRASRPNLRRLTNGRRRGKMVWPRSFRRDAENRTRDARAPRVNLSALGSIWEFGFNA